MSKEADYLEMIEQETKIKLMCDEIKSEVHRLGIMASNYYYKDKAVAEDKPK